MKHIHLLLATLIPLVGCVTTKESDIPAAIKTIDSFSVSFEKEAKASIENGGGVKWGEQDSILVFSDIQEPVMMYRDMSDGKFKGNSIRGSVFYAYHPASAKGPVSFNKENRLVLGYRNHGFLRGDIAMNIPMVAKSTGDNLVFKQTCGMLHLKLTGSDQLLYLEIKSNNEEVVSGDGTIDLSEEIPVFKMGDGQDNMIVNCPEHLSLAGSWDIYVPLPTTQLTQGLTLSAVFRNVDDQELVTNVITTDKLIDIQRAQMISMSSVDVDSLPHEDTIVENVTTKEDVISWGDEMIQYVTVIDENSILLDTDTPKSQIPQIGDILFYLPDVSGQGMFIGKVTSVEETEEGFLVKTEIPDVDEVFNHISLSAEMNTTNSFIVYEHDDEDTFDSVEIVDNSIWDTIETLYSEDIQPSASDIMRFSSSEDLSSVPVDLTFLLPTNSNSEYFNGNVFVRLSGTIYFSSSSTYAMDVNLRIGLEGNLTISGYSVDRKYYTLVKAKKGFHIYGNNLLGIRFNPSLEWFAGGGIRLEAGMKYELVNSDIKVLYSQGDFQHSAIDLPHDYYFRVKSLHSEAQVGIDFKGAVYAFLFSDRFLSAGVNLRAGIQLEGEKNVGIQFPDLANFDFHVGVTPFGSIQPFVSVRSGGKLQKLEGPEYSVKLKTYKWSLIPDIDIHGDNYERKTKKLSVDASISGENTSFIETKQGGIALFKKGDDRPVALKQISEVTTQSDNTISFDIDSIEDDYYLTKYVETYNDGFVFGDLIDVNTKPHVTMTYEMIGEIVNFNSLVRHWSYDDRSTYPFLIRIDDRYYDVTCELEFDPDYIDAEFNSLFPQMVLQLRNTWGLRLVPLFKPFSLSGNKATFNVDNEQLSRFWQGTSQDPRMWKDAWDTGILRCDVGLYLQDSSGAIYDTLFQNLGTIETNFHNGVDIVAIGEPKFYSWYDPNLLYIDEDEYKREHYDLYARYIQNITLRVPGNRFGEVWFAVPNNILAYYKDRWEREVLVLQLSDAKNVKIIESDIKNSTYVISFDIIRGSFFKRVVVGYPEEYYSISDAMWAFSNYIEAYNVQPDPISFKIEVNNGDIMPKRTYWQSDEFIL